jgi:Tfp pilus assembly protein PilX
MRRYGKKFVAPAMASGALMLSILAPVGHAQLPTCPPGTTNVQYCQVGPPVLSAQALSAACRASAARVHIPATTITSVGGLKRVTVKLDGRTIKTVKISAKTSALNSFTLKNLSISTKGLKAGLHTVTVTAVDAAGRTARRVFRFTICKPKPKFTG